MAGTQDGSVEREVRDFYARWFGAMESGDVDGALELLADDFFLKGPGQAPVTDRATLRDALRQFHAAVTEDVDYRIEDLHVAGDWAWVRITERTTIRPRDGSEPHVITGTHLGILVRDPEGDWRLHRDVSSLDARH